MKVLHITNNYPNQKFPIFGIFVKEQIDSLNKVGMKNSVFFINGRDTFGAFEYILSCFKLRHVLTKRKFDILHCHHALSALCTIASRPRKIHTIVSFQNNPSNELGHFIYNIIKKKVNACIFKDNSRLVKKKNNYYLPNGVDTEFFKPIKREIACHKLSLNPSMIHILFISSNFIRKQKRIDRFNDTVELLKIKYKIKNLKPIFLINEPRHLIPFYLNATDVHLLTSDFEGSPNSVKECMACNTPVVSTPVGNVKELLSNVDGSYVANSFDVDELAKLVFKSLNDQLDNGRKKIFKNQLDINSVAKKLKKIYSIL